MKPRTYSGWATGLSGAGAAFAGYLSSVKLLSGVCAFDEPCPFFLGYPAYYTGFALFVSMLVISAIAPMASTFLRLRQP